MTFADMRRTLFDRLAVRMHEIGFKARRSHADFGKKEPWGASRIHLMSSTHHDGVGVTAEMVLRIDEVENVIAPYYPDVEQKYVKEFPTLSMEFGYHVYDKYHIWQIRTESDLSVCETEIFGIVVDACLPFFEKYNKVEEAYELLHAGGKKGERYSGQSVHRGMALIVMANMLGRSDDIPEIIESYRPLIARTQDYELPRFEEFLKGVGAV